MILIRILHIFTCMDRGGAETMIMNYYRAMDRSKIQFDFLVHKTTRGEYDDEIKSLGGRIFVVDKVNPLFPFPYFQKLTTFFKQHPEYKIIHAHLNAFTYFPFSIAKKNNITCRIIHAHIAKNNVDFKMVVLLKISLIAYIKDRIHNYIKKRAVRSATKYVACGEKAGQWLFGQASFEIIPNAVSLLNFKENLTKKEEYQRKAGLKETDIVIGHVGSFTDQKNHFYLLNIFLELLKVQPKAKLLLVGDGPLKKAIQKKAFSNQISNKIIFLGKQSDVHYWYQVMDIFVFPSLYEGFPMVLIEAQASGVPIIASSEISEEVNITKTINFLSVNEPEVKWVEEIVQHVKKTKFDHIKKLKERGYDIKSNAKQIESFYLNMI